MAATVGASLAADLVMGHDQTQSALSNLSGAGDSAFAELAPLAAAWAWADALAPRTMTETMPLAAAHGRVLAEEASFNPAAARAPRAAMNGYAVRAAACVGAGTYNPLTLALLPPGTAILPEGASCPIASGWALPVGADAVLPHDAAQVDGAGRLEILDAVPRGAGIEEPGPALHLPAGHRLQPQDLGCLAAAGAASIAVWRRPRVALMVPGAKSGPDVLTPMLHALLVRDGAAVATIPLAPEDQATPLAALSTPALDDCDLALIAGRAGFGVDDITPAQVQAAGGSMALHGLALRPGGSAGLASLQRRGGMLPLLLLPGDPFGCLAVYDLLAARLVRRFAGITPALPYPVASFPLVRKIVSGLGSTDLVAVRLADGQAEPIADAGLVGVALADGFVLVSEGSEGYPAGASVPIHLYGSAMQGRVP
jgi:molybdopterin molybdotransferase